VRLAVGFAGVPQEIFDGFRRGESKLLERGDIVIAESFRRRDAGFYANPHANFFLKEFASLLREDNNNQMEHVGFAVAYVSSHVGAAQFAKRLFPTVLTIPVSWELSGYNRTTWGKSLAELNVLFRQAVILARDAIPALKKELVEQDNRTPWLLPIRNFRSDCLIRSLESVHEVLCSDGDRVSAIRRLRREFEQSHPPQRIGTRQRPCFVDDVGIEFHPPGGARHAFARGNYDGHPPICLVGGRRRLGSPYDRAFHYDCAQGEGALRATLASCHTGLTVRVGSPHINVAPNDFVRV
jgi:hypothetical protein